MREHSRVVAGVAVMALPVQREPTVSPELITEVSDALLDMGDVVGADAAD